MTGHTIVVTHAPHFGVFDHKDAAMTSARRRERFVISCEAESSHTGEKKRSFK
jgi:hypothetical protein